MIGFLEIDTLYTKQETEASEGEGNIQDLSTNCQNKLKRRPDLKIPQQTKPFKLCEQNNLALFLERQ